jgi:hypothetical protein
MGEMNGVLRRYLVPAVAALVLTASMSVAVACGSDRGAEETTGTTATTGS